MPDVEDLDKTLFFVSRIGEEASEGRKRSDDIMSYLLTPLAAELETPLDVVRADHLDPHGRISDRIIQHLSRSALVVADITGLNANVFYELGIRQAFKKPTVIIVDDPNTIPFDIKSEFALILPGNGPLLVGDVENKKPVLLGAMKGALTTGTPQGPVASAEALLTVTDIPEKEANEILRRDITELRERLTSLETMTIETARSVGSTVRTQRFTLDPYRRLPGNNIGLAPPLPPQDRESVLAIVRDILRDSPQVGSVPDITVTGNQIDVSYVGTEGAERTYYIMTGAGLLEATLSEMLTEFGLGDQGYLDSLRWRLAKAGLK